MVGAARSEDPVFRPSNGWPGALALPGSLGSAVEAESPKTHPPSKAIAQRAFLRSTSLPFAGIRPCSGEGEHGRVEMRLVMSLAPVGGKIDARLVALRPRAVKPSAAGCSIPQRHARAAFSQPTIDRSSIRCICRPSPVCGESITTLRPSGLKRGCVSHRHSPVYSLGRRKLPSGTRRPVATWYR